MLVSSSNYMIKRIFRYGWSVRHQFAKYATVGASGFLLDMASLIFFAELFGVNPTVAVVFNQLIILGYNFSLNKYWTFGNRDIPHKQAMRFAVLAACNYAFSVAAMYVFNERFGFDYRVVRLAAIGVMVSWNFLLYKHWVYTS
jgi:putative flippase GtrA